MAGGGGRLLLLVIGISLILIWPLRWAVGGLPDGLAGMEHGSYLPLHLAVELLAAAFSLWAVLAAPRRRGPLSLYPPAARVALGLMAYGGINSLGAGVAGDGWALARSLLELAGAQLLVLWAAGQPLVRTGSRRWAGVVLGLLGLGIAGFWMMHIASGGLTDGVRTAENGSYIAFHIAAELLAAITAFRSAALLLSRAADSPARALTASAMVFYASVNSLTWGIINEPVLGAILAASAVLTAVVGVVAWGPTARTATLVTMGF